jgi:hypothetical protein
MRLMRHTLIIVLACAAISAPAFAQSDLPKCPGGLAPRNRPDCRYLNPPTRPVKEPSYDSTYKWDKKITKYKPKDTFRLPDSPIGVRPEGKGGSITYGGKF